MIIAALDYGYTFGGQLLALQAQEYQFIHINLWRKRNGRRCMTFTFHYHNYIRCFFKRVTIIHLHHETWTDIQLAKYKSNAIASVICRPLPEWSPVPQGVIIQKSPQGQEGFIRAQPSIQMHCSSNSYEHSPLQVHVCLMHVQSDLCNRKGSFSLHVRLPRLLFIFATEETNNELPTQTSK